MPSLFFFLYANLKIPLLIALFNASILNDDIFLRDDKIILDE